LDTFAVQDPAVQALIELSTGRTVGHAEVIGADYAKCVKLRMAIKVGIERRRPLYVCAECLSTVYLVIRPSERLFHFRHTLEDGRCSAKTRGDLDQSEIRARKYNGLKEAGSTAK
jgi:hypothetical protein